MFCSFTTNKKVPLFYVECVLLEFVVQKLAFVLLVFTVADVHCQ